MLEADGACLGVDVLVEGAPEGGGQDLKAAADAEDGSLTVGGAAGAQEFLPVAEVNARVLEMLRALYPQVYGSCTAIRLYDQGAPIAESRTLASCGIRDGASLQGCAILE